MSTRRSIAGRVSFSERPSHVHSFLKEEDEQKPTDPPPPPHFTDRVTESDTNYNHESMRIWRRLCNAKYRMLMLLTYTVITIIAVIDRFTTNWSPRQGYSIVKGWKGCEKYKTSSSGDDVLSSSCGNDYFCGTQEDFDQYSGQLPQAVGGDWCLKPGPTSVKVYDALSRISGRVIITTLIFNFLTMCHCSFNFLAAWNTRTRSFFWNVKEDNLYLHAIFGWIAGICTVVHVWSLFLPSIFDGYTNVMVTINGLSWPAQVSLGASQVDVTNQTANWGVDDVWRLAWMTLIFCILFPVSRSIRVLNANYSIAMWLHVGIAMGYFIDAWRRRTHPHVWLVNSPFLLWYIVDRVAGLIWYRVNKRQKFIRINLDENYQVLLWKQPDAAILPKRRLCDVYRLKTSGSRFLEYYHPYTCASNGEIVDSGDGGDSAPDGDSAPYPIIERPFSVDDPAWPGHKFRVADWDVIREKIDDKGHNNEKFNQNDFQKVWQESYSDPRHRNSDTVKRFSMGDDTLRESVKLAGQDGGHRGSTILSSVGDDTTIRDSIKIDHPGVLDALETGGNDDDDLVAAEGGEAKAKLVLERRRTNDFVVFRKANSRHSSVQGYSIAFDQIALVRVCKTHDEADCGSCSGCTSCASFQHEPETMIWAESGNFRDNYGDTRTIEMNVQGPYMSEYGRLQQSLEMNDGPPILVICTGAGAGLAIDTFSCILRNKIELKKPVDIIYSSWSLPLLQYVTNTLTAHMVPNLFLTCALTRQDEDYEFDEAIDPAESGIMFR